MADDDNLCEIEKSIQNDLTPEDRAVLDRARELYREKIEGGELDHWLVIGAAHNIHVRLALRLAGTNKRSGPKYSKYLHDFMRHDGIDDRDKKLKGILTALAWLCDDGSDWLRVLAEDRATMSPGELARMNSPHTARSYIKKKMGIVGKPRTVSPMAKLTQEKRDLQGQVKDLTERLAHAEAGSLFSREDRPKDIANVLTSSNLSPDKLRQVMALVKEYLIAHADDKAPLPKLKAKK